MITSLKNNRLKIASSLAITADILMGLAGGVGFFFLDRADHLGDIFLMVACVFGVVGHGALVVWGKGGNSSNKKTKELHVNLLHKTLKPWRYPLDWGFFNFIVAGVLYALAGLAFMNIPLVLKGILAAIASAIGWLWPQNKPILGLHVLQFTAILYAVVSISTLLAGLVAQNLFIIAAALAWMTGNVILYTVRKENQSSFTQEI